MPDQPARKPRLSIISSGGILLALASYLLINALFSAPIFTAKIDLTEDGLYTLSDGTQAILSRLSSPIELHFFFSERLAREVPYYASYARRLGEILNETASASNGNVVIYRYNPLSFSEEEDRAVSFGLQGVPLDQGGELAYFGLAGDNESGDIELIPFFQVEREALLEYDLMQLIYRLSNPETKVLGLMSSLPVMGDVQTQMQGGLSMPWAIAEHLRKRFDIMNIPEAIDAIPEEIDVMMVIHPRQLNERSLYELEQFLFRGGRAMLFVDPKFESDLGMSPEQTSTSATGLNRLFKQWGIAVPEGQLVADRSMALRINAGTAEQPMAADYILWLRIDGDNMSATDPVTSQLPELNIATSGFIRRDDQSALQVEPLLTSSQNSTLINADEVLGFRPDILGLAGNFQPDDKRYVLAARLSGQVQSAFADGPPPRLVSTEETQPPQLASGAINVVLVADADLLDERFWLRKQPFFGRPVEQKIAGNGDFVLNALGNLVGGDDLLSLRTRGVSQRPFEKIEELERQAELKYQQKERQLQVKLAETQEKIANMTILPKTGSSTTTDNPQAADMSDDQRREIAMLRNQMLVIRKELRSVQLSLRQDVETLQSRLKFINIGLMPMLLIALAIMLSLYRVLRHRTSLVQPPVSPPSSQPNQRSTR